MKAFATLLSAALVAALPALGRADEKSHRQAVEELLQVTNMEKVLQTSMDTMLEAQVRANPRLTPYRDAMRKFFEKYMSWSSLKEDFVKLYMDEFSEEEVKQLTAFYRTPIGKKTLEKLPQLMVKGSKLGTERVQAHLDELQKMMREADEKKKAGDKP
jgi:hypothetical protein